MTFSNKLLELWNGQKRMHHILVRKKSESVLDCIVLVEVCPRQGDILVMHISRCTFFTKNRRILYVYLFNEVLSEEKTFEWWQTMSVFPRPMSFSVAKPFFFDFCLKLAIKILSILCLHETKKTFCFTTSNNNQGTHQTVIFGVTLHPLQYICCSFPVITGPLGAWMDNLQPGGGWGTIFQQCYWGRTTYFRTLCMTKMLL